MIQLVAIWARRLIVETGKVLLDRLNINGFVVGNKAMYDDVAKMMRAFGEH